MKKNFIYALMSAIAFVGAAGLTACSSSDEIIDNPDYNPETNSVKTTITLSVNPASVNSGGSSATRQTSAIVQATSSDAFRGITSMVLVPSEGDFSSTSSLSGKISLDDFTTFDGSSSNYKLYVDKEVSVGVNRFLFLGKAKNNAAVSSSDVATKLASGYTTNTFTSATTVGGITVTPGTIAATTGDWTTQSNAIAAYLKTIAEATGWSTSTNSSLNGMYAKFTRTTNTAGSANAVLLTLQKLYREVSKISDDAVANIKTAITAQVDVTGENETATLAWNSSCTFKDFPTSLGLPEGAAQYKYSSGSFVYSIDGSNATSTAISKFVYPNELYYLTNTPIKVSSTKEVTWPNTASNWKSSEWTSWGDAVDGNTKNIALKYNIQYGSALLSTQVKCQAETLYDNAIVMDDNHPTVNNSIDISTKQFQLTGVIVGGQPSQVGWNYLPVSADYSNAVYDRLTATNVTTDFTAANYTLVFDDNRSEPADINVCLEFLNNTDQDFYGKDGIILAGQKFYLVGKLKVTDKTTEDNPFTRSSSPVGTDVAEATYFPSRILRAFIQDFTTTAEFTITAGSADGSTSGSLEKALSTIPDLRATSQTIGLSVDLDWRTGLKFESNLGE